MLELRCAVSQSSTITCESPGVLAAASWIVCLAVCEARLLASLHFSCPMRKDTSRSLGQNTSKYDTCAVNQSSVSIVDLDRLKSCVSVVSGAWGARGPRNIAGGILPRRPPAEKRRNVYHEVRYFLISWWKHVRICSIVDSTTPVTFPRVFLLYLDRRMNCVDVDRGCCCRSPWK